LASSAYSQHPEGNRFQAQPRFQPVYSDELSPSGFQVSPFVSAGDTIYSLEEILEEHGQETQNLRIEILQQALERMTYWVQESDVDRSFFLQISDSVFGEDPAITYRQLKALLSNHQDGVPFQIFFGIDNDMFEHLRLLPDEQIQNLQTTNVNFHLPAVYRKDIPISQLEDSFVEMITISSETFEDLTNPTSYFRNLVLYSKSAGVGIHVSGLRTRDHLIQTLEWNVRYLSGPFLSDEAYYPEEVELKARYSLQLSDLAPSADPTDTTLDNMTITGQPYTLILPGEESPEELLSLPLGYHKIPHRTCQTLDEARENLEQYEFDLLIVSHSDYDEEELPDVINSSNESVSSLPRIVIADDPDSVTEQVRGKDTTVSEVIANPFEFEEYLEALERITPKVEDTDSELTEPPSGTGVFSRKVSIYGMIVILALLFGLTLGPTLGQINKFTRSMLSQTNYLIESVEDIKGYLERDEQRDLRRQ